ncbi:MAG: hypothetical protein IPL35_09390 [Sphingobacteriales bacterium]|nr:hypothetical protein [Sphingobacteriales bacterium]
MDKRILIGLVLGLLAGLVQYFLFPNATSLNIIVNAVLGLIIGFSHTSKLPLKHFVVAPLIGLILYAVLAIQNNTAWLDELATGAIFGLLITYLVSLLGKKMG